MPDVYERCPALENDRFQLRLVRMEDAADLRAVYSDKQALPFFNSDNCHGDIFYYTTLARMTEAVRFWLDSYENRWFVRWAVIDKTVERVIGTVEGFRRGGDGHFGDVGLLRLDVGSAYERAEELVSLLSLVTPPSYAWFNCDEIITKCPPYAVERASALQQLGFSQAEHTLIGEGGRTYGDYWIRKA